MLCTRLNHVRICAAVFLRGLNPNQQDHEQSARFPLMMYDTHVQLCLGYGKVTEETLCGRQTDVTGCGWAIYCAWSPIAWCSRCSMHEHCQTHHILRGHYWRCVPHGVWTKPRQEPPIEEHSKEYQTTCTSHS